MFFRTLTIEIEGNNAFFLWGPRKVGKTTYLKTRFPLAKWYDLLNTELKTRLLIQPSLLRQEVQAQKHELVIIDEVQKVPDLLDEVHWCLENTKSKFILCGSSARKLKKGAANLLGGRAWRYELHPLTTKEIDQFDLGRIVNHGLIPKHYLDKRPERSLHGYVVDYLEEEIRQEGLTRHLPAFAQFLEAVSLSHGELINYTNIASDCGVSAKTVKEYYQILVDTLVGFRLNAWRKRKKRRLIETPKFYLFDVGITRSLSGMHKIEEGTAEFGRAFEHFLIQEIRAYLSYKESYSSLTYWRTTTGLEVDLIVGNMDLAIEFKATKKVKNIELKGLRALVDEHKVRRAIVVSRDREKRIVFSNIEIQPWQNFCQALWNDEFDL